MKEKNNQLAKAGLVVLILLSVFLFVETIHTFKSISVIERDDFNGNVITFNGEGKISAIPDIATFSFTVTKESKTVEDAQRNVENIITNVMDVLKKEGVEERDIQTEGYNVYPQYDWVRKNGYGSEKIFRGYQVSQHTTIKVRDLDNAGDILGKIGGLEVTNIGGLSFTIDDRESLEREARKIAIKEAKEKAKELSDDLGVKLVKIVNFYENNEMNYPEPYMLKAESSALGIDVAETIPTLSVGEDEIVVSVSVTYEIR